jgi:sigma-E factor negative regulatory protein RseB
MGPASRLRRWSIAGLAAAALWPGSAFCEAASGAADGAGRGVDARGWLLRVQEAARLRNYEGTLVSSDAGSITVWRVAHYFEADQQYERVDMLSGEAMTVLRHNEVVHKLWPRSHEAEVEQRDPRSGFLVLPSVVEQRITESYELQPLGIARTAGFEAEVVMLRARDAFRFSQRLWAERQTGLLLRADIVAPTGQVLDWSTFSDVTIGVKPRPALVTEQLRHLEGYRVRRTAFLPTSLDNEGWQVAAGALPPGFKPVQCAKRSLNPSGAASDPVVLQAIYSDGLTHVSLFVEPFDPKRHQGEVVGSIGATHTLMTRHDDQWVTVMGDVPTETLKRFAAALERKR